MNLTQTIQNKEVWQKVQIWERSQDSMNGEAVLFSKEKEVALPNIFSKKTIYQVVFTFELAEVKKNPQKFRTEKKEIFKIWQMIMKGRKEGQGLNCLPIDIINYICTLCIQNFSITISHDSIKKLPQKLPSELHRPFLDTNSKSIIFCVSMPVYIKFKNETFIIEVKATDTIRNLRQKISDQRFSGKGLDEALIYKNRNLVDEKTLSDYRVVPFSTFFLAHNCIG